MLKRLFAYTILAILALSSVAHAQETGTITGQITGESRQPLIGVQVTVVGTGIGTMTDQQGRYRLLRVPAGARTLRFTSLGYAAEDMSVTVQAGATVQADATMRVSAVELDQVVVSAVTGRAERKRELGTNTASISSKDIERVPITKMADVLTARAPGVQLQGMAGSVGTSQRIRIRGANSISLSNEPLVFIDGIQFSNTRGGFAVGGQDYSRLNDINPEDIANIEVLKGPAASALYGTAAANGVILITTKRGVMGRTQWRAYAEVGRNSDENPYPVNYLPFQVNTATATMFTTRGNLNTAGGANAAYFFCPLYAPGSTRNVANGSCRQDQNLQLVPMQTSGLNPFRTGRISQYGLSASGGTDIVNFYLSGDMSSERGVINFNTEDRLNLRANFGARLRENLNVNVNAGYTRRNLWLNANDNNVFSPLINALLATPVVPTDSQRAASPAGARWGTGFGHYITDIEENLSNQIIDRFIIGASTTVQPVSWLSLNANVGMDYFGRNDANTVQPNRLPIAASYTIGFRQGQRNSNYIWTTNGAAVATRQIKQDLGSTTTLGASFSREQNESTYCYGAGIVEGTRTCSAASSLFSIAEGYSEVRTIGAYLQEQLNWRDRLIVSGSVRGDDNSAFGQDFGFILYPGASVSWVASQEPFIHDRLGFMSNLRLRGAFGLSGQRPGVRDAVTLYDPTAVTINNQEITAVRLFNVGNIALKPEKTTEIEGGFDAGFFEDRFGLEFTYFQRKSKDALVSRPLPPSSGLRGDVAGTGAIFENLGSVRNWGMELSFHGRVFTHPQAALDLRLAASTLHNRIEDMGDLDPIIFNRGNQQHKLDFPTGGFFGRRYEIVNPGQQRILTPADVRMVDDTSVFLGPSLPTNTQVLGGDLSLFRNLVIVTGLFERRAGHRQLNYTELFRCQTGYNNSTGGAARGNCAAVADPNASLEEQARWLANRFGATWLNPTTGATQLVSTSAGYVEKADFIKLREVAITLNVPQALTRRFSMLSGASVTLSGRNLATWTDYTGLDPEINETGGGANFTQGEFNTQPPLRYYTLRFNVLL